MKRFSALNPTVAAFYDPPDRETLRWTARLLTPAQILPPPAAKIEGDIYLLADFDGMQELTLLVNLESLEQAFALSIEIYGIDTVTFVEWLAIYNKCAELGINFAALPLPSAIKNNLDACLRVFAAASGWNETLVTYIGQKNVPWKILGCLAGMDKDKTAYITDYIMKALPSLQSFRQFVESVADFADRITGVTYDHAVHAALTDRRSPTRAEVDSIVGMMNGTVTVANKDNWETPTLYWNFITKSAEQYEGMLKLLGEYRRDVRALYTLLGETEK